MIIHRREIEFISYVTLHMNNNYMWTKDWDMKDKIAISKKMQENIFMTYEFKESHARPPIKPDFHERNDRNFDYI